MIVYPALFHDSVRRMTRFDFRIHRYVFIGMRAEPDIVVAFSVTDKPAAVLLQNFPYFLFVLGHYAKATFSRRSTEKRTDGRMGK